MNDMPNEEVSDQSADPREVRSLPEILTDGTSQALVRYLLAVKENEPKRRLKDDENIPKYLHVPICLEDGLEKYLERLLMHAGMSPSTSRSEAVTLVEAWNRTAMSMLFSKTTNMNPPETHPVPGWSNHTEITNVTDVEISEMFGHDNGKTSIEGSSVDEPKPSQTSARLGPAMQARIDNLAAESQENDATALAFGSARDMSRLLQFITSSGEQVAVGSSDASIK